MLELVGVNVDCVASAAPGVYVIVDVVCEPVPDFTGLPPKVATNTPEPTRFGAVTVAAYVPLPLRPRPRCDARPRGRQRPLRPPRPPRRIRNSRLRLRTRPRLDRAAAKSRNKHTGADKIRRRHRRRIRAAAVVSD